MTYIKHSHKAEARRECRVACLLFVFFRVTGEGSRHSNAFGLGAGLKWPVGLLGQQAAASCRLGRSPETSIAPLHGSDLPPSGDPAHRELLRQRSSGQGGT